MRIIINIKQRTGHSDSAFTIKLDPGVKDTIAETNMGTNIHEALCRMFAEASEEDRNINVKRIK